MAEIFTHHGGELKPLLFWELDKYGTQEAALIFRSVGKGSGIKMTRCVQPNLLSTAPANISLQPTSVGR